VKILSVFSIIISVIAVGLAGFVYYDTNRGDATVDITGMFNAESKLIPLKGFILKPPSNPDGLLRTYYSAIFDKSSDTVYFFQEFYATTEFYRKRRSELIESLEVVHFLKKDNLAVALIRMREGMTEYHASMWFEKVNADWKFARDQHFSAKYSTGNLVKGKRGWLEETVSIVDAWKESANELP